MILVGENLISKGYAKIVITLSLCMIVKNEEENLARCLESVSGLFDEIVVVDTGSKDNTVAVADAFGARVAHFEWRDDFAAARNFSFSLASKSHIMWLDADDVLSDAARDGLIALKRTLPSDTDIVMLPYNTAFDDAGRPVFTYMRERIVRADAGFLWHGAVHEAIEVRGKVIYADFAIEHRKTHITAPGRNLGIYRKMLERGESLSARDKLYYARELYYTGDYRESKRQLRRLIASGDGWIENRIEAYRILSYILRAENHPEKALRTLLLCIAEGRIKAELCCEIAALFMEKNDLHSAIFWYNSALGAKSSIYDGAFVNPDCSGYIPYMQLCVCYDRLGDRKAAKRCNDMAGKLKPESKAYLANKSYFESLGI